MSELHPVKDLHLISYLDMLGFKYTVRKNGEEGTALFEDSDNEVKNAIKDYYNDVGGFQSFGNKIRNVKSRIKNS